ncbi:MAG: cation transporter [Bacteroidales bacterium]|nr:cation transporter [Bacteroidales bacterium]
MAANAREKDIYKVTIVGAAGNAILLLFKFVAGILGNSAAMIADAVHSLSDMATDIVVLVFVKISGKPKDASHDYGHGKYETLATAIIGIALFAVGVGILVKSIESILFVIKGGVIESPGWIALAAAVASVIIKEILYRYTAACGKRNDSQAVVANAWHHRSDALSSIGTAVGIGGAIILGEKWRVLDPIAAFVVSFFILKVAVELVIPALDELLEKSLPEEVEKQIEDIILSHKEITDPHNMRTRRIGNYCAIDVHVRMDGNITLSKAHEVTVELEKELREALGSGTLIYIHPEPMRRHPEGA